MRYRDEADFDWIVDGCRDAEIDPDTGTLGGLEGPDAPPEFAVPYIEDAVERDPEWNPLRWYPPELASVLRFDARLASSRDPETGTTTPIIHVRAYLDEIGVEDPFQRADLIAVVEACDAGRVEADAECRREEEERRKAAQSRR